jgi:hypothetical protein
MGNERGTGPATSVSPVSPANKKGEAPESRTPPFIHRVLTKTAAEITHVGCRRPNPSFVDPDEAAEIEIEAIYRRAIAGLRQLPRRERPYAMRVAKDALMFALKALREKRATKRHGEHMLRKLKAEPVPS